MPFVFHTTINKDGTQSLRYQVNYKGKKWPVPTGYKCKPGNFKNGRIKGATAEVNENLRTIEDIIDKAVKKASQSFPNWTVDRLKTYITLAIESGNTDHTGNVRHFLYHFWEKRIQYYKDSDKTDSYVHNTNSRKQIFKVLPEDIYIDEITKHHLRLILEKLETGRSTSTLNGYFRDLRTIINLAIEQNIIQLSPFKGFRLPKMKTRSNAALTWEELQAFKTVKVKTKYQEQVRDMAMFRYYCLGMRIKDQLHLTTDNLKGNKLTYITSKNKKQFSFTLDQECIDIINRWKKGKVLFPVTNNLEDAYRVMNRSLKRIAGYAGIEKQISTHTFRHTFASINRGITDLQSALGHSSAKTTEGYKATLTTQDHLINQIKR